MNIVIAGGSGFLGRALKTRLCERGDVVRVLTRKASQPDDVAWSPNDLNGAWATMVAEADAVINLAGESVAGGRWSAARKRVLIDSRMITTRGIVGALGRGRREGVLLNASAVGFYGPREDELLTEDSPAGNDFLATLCRTWENEATKAGGIRRLVHLRTGLVLDPHHGALAKLLTPFRLGLGGPMGSGRQYWSWIHRDDWVSLAVFALDTERVEGALNLVAPNPVTNRDFATTLGRVLRRPAVLTAPALALKLVLGEMAEAMVLGGQRVSSARARALGFTFAFDNLDAALRHLLL
jgi:uncharacterized protein (TIGR01777 family)